MRTRLIFPLCLVFWGLMAAPADATIRYGVALMPQSHLFQVTMTVPGCGHELTVAIPAWNALYQIKDFAYRVQDVQATQVSADSVGASGVPIDVRKRDKQTWQIDAPANQKALGTVRIEYSIYWDDPGPFTSQVNLHHAFLNPAEVLFYVPDRRAEDVVVSYSGLPSGWRIAAELPSAGDDTSLQARSYDDLADAPTEIGQFDEFRFTEGKAKIRVVVDGDDWSHDRLEQILRDIVRTETGMMREVPFPGYLFLFHFGSFREVSGGGMEHMNSTAISALSDDSGASVAAHEFFHLWNVKRIRPQALEPVDYTREQYTRALWFAEGVTNTYASYTMLRSGLWGTQQFYQDLADAFAELDSRPARKWQSVEESSLDAWLEEYSTYNAPDFSVSYYNKGQIVGVLLDIAIRDATDNRRSLDDVLRAMNNQFAHEHRFYNDSDDIRAVVERVSGRSFEDFFRQYVSGTSDIPANQFLNLAGLELKPDSAPLAELGFWPANAPNGGLTAIDVEPGSQAEAAGLREGDSLLMLNGETFPMNEARWLRGHAPGETVHLRIRRAGIESELAFQLGEHTARNYQIEELPGATERQQRIRDGILHGTTSGSR